MRSTVKGPARPFVSLRAERRRRRVRKSTINHIEDFQSKLSHHPDPLGLNNFISLALAVIKWVSRVLTIIAILGSFCLGDMNTGFRIISTVLCCYGYTKIHPPTRPYDSKKEEEDKQKQNVASRLLQAKEAFTFAMHKLFYQMVWQRDGGNWWCVAKAMPKIEWPKQ